jgi:hypothetical protein
MAAATVTGRNQNEVFGGRVAISADSIVFASGSDTWNTGLASIDFVILTPTTNIAPAFTISGGVVTAINAGTYAGGVIGNF